MNNQMKRHIEQGLEASRVQELPCGVDVFFPYMNAFIKLEVLKPHGLRILHKHD